MAEIGQRWTYGGPAGLGHIHADGPLHPEMHELDMAPGTVVEVLDHDTARDLVLVGWTDAPGNPRTTSIEPAIFAQHFVEA
jgi:hypothetical protein